MGKSFLKNLTLSALLFSTLYLTACLNEVTEKTDNQSDILIPISTPIPAENNDPWEPTPNSISVMQHGAKGDGISDDSKAFQSAIDLATQSSRNYPQGPSGPQTVVYVPPGKYRIREVYFKDNVRLEIDAAATLMGVAPGKDGDSYLNLDHHSSVDVTKVPPIRNVSVVGVGSSMSGKPNPEYGFDISHSFTLDQDVVRTGVSAIVAPITVGYVDGYLLQNIFSIQSSYNDQQASRPAAVEFKPENRQSKAPNFYDAHNGKYFNHYNIKAWSGYGGQEVITAHGLEIRDIYSEGGVALRFETDVPENRGRGDPNCTSTTPCLPDSAEVSDVTAKNIVCKNGNSGVYFAAHVVTNKNVHVDGVISDGCYSGVTYSSETAANIIGQGKFLNSSINNVKVISGTNAQKPDAKNDTWTVVPSANILNVDFDSLSWVFYPDVCTYSGVFSSRVPDRSGKCVPSTANGP